MALLELAQVTKRYGGIIAVNEASFSVDQGSITSLIGPNGAGKTTAFDTISGVIEVDSGNIRYGGKDITQLRPHAVTKLGIGRTFQVTRELGDMTIVENLAVASVPNSFKSLTGSRVHKDEYGRAMDVLDFLGIQKLAHEFAKRLSYGQRKLLELASVLMTEPAVPPPCRKPMVMVVRIKATKPATVSLCSRVAAPRAPKADWVLPPPKTERSAPLPCCSRTTRIRNRQTTT